MTRKREDYDLDERVMTFDRRGRWQRHCAAAPGVGGGGKNGGGKGTGAPNLGNPTDRVKGGCMGKDTACNYVRQGQRRPYHNKGGPCSHKKPSPPAAPSARLLPRGGQPPKCGRPPPAVPGDRGRSRGRGNESGGRGPGRGNAPSRGRSQTPGRRRAPRAPRAPSRGRQSKLVCFAALRGQCQGPEKQSAMLRATSEVDVARRAQKRSIGIIVACGSQTDPPCPQCEAGLRCYGQRGIQCHARRGFWQPEGRPEGRWQGGQRRKGWQAPMLVLGGRRRSTPLQRNAFSRTVPWPCMTAPRRGRRLSRRSRRLADRSVILDPAAYNLLGSASNALSTSSSWEFLRGPGRFSVD